MATTVNDVLEQLLEDNIDPRFATKVERMRKRMSEEELARWLFDRSRLPDELKKKYGLNKVMSNVSASEIPEEAPDYVGDVDTATAAGMKPELADRFGPGADAPEPGEPTTTTSHEPLDSFSDEEEEVEVTDYNDLNVESLKATIKTRNQGREDDEKISVDSDARKADLVAALEEDDEYMAERNEG